MITLNWFSSELKSSEYFTSVTAEDGHRLEGDVVLPAADAPARIAYRLEVDAQWRTRHVRADIDRAGERRHIELTADGNGGWQHVDPPVADLTGCLDVDLGWTPATNTLPIRRLQLDVGEERTIDIAWVRFPEMTLERVAQTYRRLDERSWQYSSGSFTAKLEVDAHGYVLRYGSDLWVASAYSSGNDAPS